MKGDGHEGCVTAICRGNDNTLFTCGDDCRVIVWSLETGSRISSWETENEKPTAIVYLPNSNQLVVAGRQLYVWSMEDSQLVSTLTGHSSHIMLLKYVVIKSKEFVITASKADRTLTLWRIKQSKSRPISYSYLMEDIAYSVACRSNDDQFEIAAVTRSGVMHLYVVESLARSINEMSIKPTKPKLTIEIANDSSQLVEPIPIHTALWFGESQKQIQIGYGNRQNLCFELVTPDYSERRQVLTRNTITSKQKISNKLRVANALKTVTPIINMSAVEFQSKNPRKSKKTEEVPMEIRLENLTFDSLGSNKGKQGQNVAQLLVQGLHSHDPILLKTAFMNKDEQVVRATLKRIPPQYIASLIVELTELAQKKSSK